MRSPGRFATLAAAFFFSALVVPVRGCASDACQGDDAPTACPAALEEAPELTEAPAAPPPEKCKNQILCKYIRELYNNSNIQSLCDEHDSIRIKPDINETESSWVIKQSKHLDINKDGKISFEEFYYHFKILLSDFVTLLDRNQDGSILDEAQSGAMLEWISFTFFETFLKHLYVFLDENKDKVLTLYEVMKPRLAEMKRLDQNNDGELSLQEVTGSLPSTFPGPIYSLYKKLDKNSDEKLSQDEAMDFMKSFLETINTNADCYIESKEIVTLLDKLGLPWENQIGAKMAIDHYLTLASQVLKVFTERADTDNDKRVTPSQVIELEMEVLKDDINLEAMQYLVYPSGAYLAVIACPKTNNTIENNFYGRPSCDQGQMWLEILEKLVDLLK